MAITDELRDLVARALAEDVGAGDVTGEAVVAADARANARIVQKSPGVLFGLEAAEEVFRQAGCDGFEALAREGEWRDEVPADVALRRRPGSRGADGRARRAQPAGPHVGVATLTAQFVEAAGDGDAVILDTRKTLPGLREVEKAAVVAGGGRNHRIGLHDAILIKENHAALAGGIEEAVRRARDAQPEMPVEIEVRDAAEVQEALAARSRPAAPRQHGVRRHSLRGRRSRRGGAREPATAPSSRHPAGSRCRRSPGSPTTGVDFISVGALTHSAPALDLSLLFEPA